MITGAEHVVKPTMTLLFHAGDVLFSLGIVVLMLVAVIALFTTMAQRLNVKNRKRRPASKRAPKRKSGR